MKKILLLLIFTFCFFGKMMGQNYTESYGALAEIAGTGTSVTMTYSASSAALPIGFNFQFWENTYNEFYINPSGAIQFSVGSATGYSGANPNTANGIPKVALPNNFLAFAWTGGSNVSTADINYFTVGSAPNRTLVINFKNVKQSAYSWPIPATVNTQIQLYEGVDGKIEIHNINNDAYCSNTQYSGTTCMEKIVGIENSTGTIGKSVTNSTNWSLSNRMLRFVYCPTNVPIPTNVTPNVNSCGAPGTINLSANCSVGTAVWYSANKTPLSSTIVNPTTYTNYFVRCEYGNCASDYVSTIVNITTPPEAPTLTKSSPTATNPGTQVTLTANGCSYGTLNWSDGLSQVNNYSGSLQRDVFPTQTTTYKVNCTISSCLGPDAEIIVDVISPPTIAATSPTTFCSGGTITLSATGCGAAEVNWPDGTHGLTWTSPVINNLNANTTANSTFTATCTVGGTTTGSSNVINASIYGKPAPPTITIDNDYVIAGSALSLTAAGSTNFEWSWTDGTGAHTSTANPLAVNPTESTVYNVVAKYNECPSVSTSKSITVYPAAPTITSANAIINDGQTATLVAGGCAAPGVVSWYLSQGQGQYGQQTTMDPSFTTLPLTSASGSTLYRYAAKCTVNGVSSNYSSQFIITVNAVPSTITIDNTTPTLVCGTKGTVFYVDFTKTGSFANTYTTVELYERKNFEGINIYTTLLETSGSNTNRAPLGLNTNLESSHGGGNPTLTYYILVKNGTVSASWPITISSPSTPIITVSGTLPITTIGQSITLNTAPVAGITKQWYKQLPGIIGQLLTGETNDNLTIIPEETAYYSVKSTGQVGCVSNSLGTKIPIEFSLSGASADANKTYTEGKIPLLLTGDCGDGNGGTVLIYFGPKKIEFDNGTHFYGVLTYDGGCFNRIDYNWVGRINNIWGIYKSRYEYGGQGNSEYFEDRIFHTKDPFPTIPGARVAATSITNTVPPTTAVWINDATGEEVTLSLNGATEQPLPLTLISFTGKATEKGNILNWKTANEKAFSHFEIQSSVDAQKFEKIGEVQGKNSENYELVDNSQKATQNSQLAYYRLKMIDLDGSFTFSKIINIENKKESALVFPNPAIDHVFIENVNGEQRNYKIIDGLGRQHFALLNSRNKVEKLSLINMQSGLYYIQIQSIKGLEYNKLLINK